MACPCGRQVEIIKAAQCRRCYMREYMREYRRTQPSCPQPLPAKTPTRKFVTFWRYTSEEKCKHRDAIISAWRAWSDMESIPVDSYLVSLCAAQHAKSDQAEVNQLVQRGLISRDQYHGVDADLDAIQHNRSQFPDVHWHHGRVQDVIGSLRKASLVNLDFCQGLSELRRPALRKTLAQLGPSTLVAVNLTAWSSRERNNGIYNDEDEYLEELERRFHSQVDSHGHQVIAPYEYWSDGQRERKYRTYFLAREDEQKRLI